MLNQEINQILLTGLVNDGKVATINNVQVGTDPTSLLHNVPKRLVQFWGAPSDVKSSDLGGISQDLKTPVGSLNVHHFLPAWARLNVTVAASLITVQANVELKHGSLVAREGSGSFILCNLLLLHKLGEPRNLQIIQRTTTILPLLQSHLFLTHHLQIIERSLKVHIILHLREGVLDQRLPIQILASPLVLGYSIHFLLVDFTESYRANIGSSFPVVWKFSSRG
mmetsp:Transcript_20074/g.42021  ORF Transcript_20074/g.42021 Transcript_20074/m.42021 type:complete len:224 (-) Transcript_20074:74-745(-)